MKRSKHENCKRGGFSIVTKVALSALVVLFHFVYIAVLFYTSYNDGSQTLVELMNNA